MTENTKRPGPALALAAVLAGMLLIRGCSSEPSRPNAYGAGYPAADIRMVYAPPGQGAAPPMESGGDGSFIHRGPGGTTGGSGDTFYYNDPDSGSSVMTGGN